jgi:hypothetical protein
MSAFDLNPTVISELSENCLFFCWTRSLLPYALLLPVAQSRAASAWANA